MRKGSTDHLALDIDGESNRLINNEETDEDKGSHHMIHFTYQTTEFLKHVKEFHIFLVFFPGHAFKSLNTSGLVPRQGKLIADRIDGIW